MKTRYIALLLFSILTLPVVAWESAGTWVRHTAEPDGRYLPQAVTFELPDYIVAPRRSKVPQWKFWASGPRAANDYFQVLFGGHSAGILKATEADLGRESTHDQMNQVLRKRTLDRLSRQPRRYKVMDENFLISSSGATAILFEERDTHSKVSNQRAILEKVLASLPPAEREREIQKNLGSLSDKHVYHLAIFNRGQKVNVTVNFTSQDMATKKKILNRFLSSISLS